MEVSQHDDDSEVQRVGNLARQAVPPQLLKGKGEKCRALGLSRIGKVIVMHPMSLSKNGNGCTDVKLGNLYHTVEL